MYLIMSTIQLSRCQLLRPELQCPRQSMRHENTVLSIRCYVCGPILSSHIRVCSPFCLYAFAMFDVLKQVLITTMALWRFIATGIEVRIVCTIMQSADFGICSTLERRQISDGDLLLSFLLLSTKTCPLAAACRGFRALKRYVQPEPPTTTLSPRIHVEHTHL
jgi:hypothetical protein